MYVTGMVGTGCNIMTLLKRSLPCTWYVTITLSLCQAWRWWKHVAGKERIFYGTIIKLSLTDILSPLGILAVNTIVFCMWRLPPMQRLMTWYFQSAPDRSMIVYKFYFFQFVFLFIGPVISMLLSCFSHYEFWHISINMFVLWSFMPAFERTHLLC